MIKSLLNITCLFYIIAALHSCANVKQLRYMQGPFDSTSLSHYTIPEPVVQKNDLLGIVVYSDNPEATKIYNQSISNSGTAPASSSSSSGYLVDEDGNIQFQGLGSLHVEGLSRAGLTSLLNSKLKEFLTNPYYNIRFLNYKITIIGDVAKPAVYTIPSERINLLEAIGLAGDLNVTARRDSVRIIREQNGKRTIGFIDLRQPDIFNNPFYQLKQNDIVYVDLTKTKAAANDAVIVRNIGLVTGIISTIAIIVTVIKY